MPKQQTGSVVKRGKRNHAARYYDEHGVRRYQGGFETQTAAEKWLREKVDEISALRRGDIVPASHRPQTVDALLDTFLEKHGAIVDPLTKKKLTRELRRARSVFGDRHPDSLNRLELEDWRATLASGSRHNAFRAFRQALTWGHTRGLTEREPSRGIRNPKRKRHERKPIIPFETWDEIGAAAEELNERYAAIPVFAVGTGLRPEEWIALERSDIDREARLVRVCKRYSDGVLNRERRPSPRDSSHSDSGSSTRSTPCRHESTRPSCSRPRVAATSRSTSSGIASGRRRCALQASPTGRSTRCDTHSRPGPSRTAGSRSRSSRQSWARPSARSRTPTSAGSAGRTRLSAPRSTTTTSRLAARLRVEPVSGGGCRPQPPPSQCV